MVKLYFGYVWRLFNYVRDLFGEYLIDFFKSRRLVRNFFVLVLLAFLTYLQFCGMRNVTFALLWFDVAVLIYFWISSWVFHLAINIFAVSLLFKSVLIKILRMLQFCIWFFYLAPNVWFFLRFSRNGIIGTFINLFALVIIIWLDLGILLNTNRYVGWKFFYWFSWPRAINVACLRIFTLLSIVRKFVYILFILLRVSSHWVIWALFLWFTIWWLPWKFLLVLRIANLMFLPWSRVLPWSADMPDLMFPNAIIVVIIILVLGGLGYFLVDLILLLIPSRFNLR